MVTRRRSSYHSTLPHKQKRSLHNPLIALVILILVIGSVVYVFADKSTHNNEKMAIVPAAIKKPVKQVSTTKTNTTATVTQDSEPNVCAANTLPELVLVSISQRHLWACAGASTVFNSAVVTGMENLPADLTPVGTYHIYAKDTDLYLNGSDSTGSWHDYVYYWMPFLDNQYGAYGLHDATWRPADAFGNISPYSSNASHGCVEMPLATAKWIYDWVSIGTTVTIES
jgi:lipoprotein-anchoring transpeptidase ErfK/SrfK